MKHTGVTGTDYDPYMIPCPSDGAENKKEKPYQVQTKYGGIRYMTGEEIKYFERSFMANRAKKHMMT